MRTVRSRHGTSRLVAVVILIAMVGSSLGVFTLTVAASNPSAVLAIGKLSPKALTAALQEGTASVRVLVETIGQPSSRVTDAIRNLGGTVVIRFAFTHAVAAYVPANR